MEKRKRKSQVGHVRTHTDLKKRKRKVMTIKSKIMELVSITSRIRTTLSGFYRKGV